MKKLLCVLLAVFLLCLPFSACSQPEEEAPSSSEPSASTPSGSKREPVMQVPTPQPEPEETPAPEETPETLNLLTGEYTLSPEAYGKRPVAVSVNNISDSWPQYGISDADIIFEIPVEANITRLMALYGDYTKLPEVCSIRSARYYYPILAAGFDARYVHCGCDPVHAGPVMRSLGIDNLDAGTDSYGLFQRDQERLNQGYAWEHTLVFLGPKYAEAAEAHGNRTDLGEVYRDVTAFRFEKDAAPQGENCEQLRVNFGGGYYSDFTYRDGVYFKDHSGTPHMDAVTEQQLSFENLLILETDIHVFSGDKAGRKEIDILTEQADGYYISQGKMTPVFWSKPTEFSRLTVTDATGEEVPFLPGKTYIAVCLPGAMTTGEK